MGWIKRWALIAVRYNEGLNNLLAIMVGLFIVAIMLCNAYEVVMRYYFDSPTDWVLPVAEYSLLWIVSLAISYTQLKGSHIKIDAIISRAPRQMQSGVGIVISALALFFFILITWGGIRYITEALAESWNTGPVHYWPLFPILIIMPVGGFLMGVQLSINILKHITDLSTRRQNGN